MFASHAKDVAQDDSQTALDEGDQVMHFRAIVLRVQRRFLNGFFLSAGVGENN